MTDKIDSAATSTKLVLPGGQKIALGSQVGTLGALLLILWQGMSAAQSFIVEAEATRNEVSALGTRLDRMDTAITALVANEKRIDNAEAEITRLRAELAQTRLDAIAAIACAKTRGKQCPP